MQKVTACVFFWHTFFSVLVLFLVMVCGDSIRVGRTWSATGVYTGESKSITNGFQMWLTDVANRGGILLADGSRRPVELVNLNDGSDAQIVQLQYAKLIRSSNNSLHALFGPMATPLTLAAISQARIYGTPIIYSAAAVVTNATNAFSLQALVPARVKPCMDALRDKGVKIIDVVSTTDVFQLATVNAIRAYATANNMTVRTNFTYPLEAVDFSNATSYWRNLSASARPDMVVLAGQVSNAVPFLQQLRAIPFDPKAVYFANAAALTGANDALKWEAEYVVHGTQWDESLNYPDEYYNSTQGFAAAFKQRYNYSVGILEASAYAAGYALEKALANSTDENGVMSLQHTHIIAALQRLSVMSFFGLLQFQASGQTAGATVCKQIMKKRVETVAPSSLQTATLSYPGTPSRPPPPALNRREKIGMIVGLSVGGFILILVIFAVVLFIVKRNVFFVIIPRTNGVDEWNT